MKIRFLLPLICFVLVALLLFRGLSLHPSKIPSPLIGQAAPEFQLPNLLKPNTQTSRQEFMGHASLLNVWATWCYACAEEHAFLVSLAEQHKIVIFGLDYKDDSAAANTWLKEQGNPYQSVGADKEGTTAINWGVYGAPETFVIDKKGIIRYKYIGPVTPEVWDDILEPLVKQLEQAA